MSAELEQIQRQLEREQQARQQVETLLEAKTQALSEALLEKERLLAQLQHHTYHDSLTGLANRNLLHDRLEQAIAYADRYQYLVWVVMLDLDQFKSINEDVGHQTGDRFLQVIAHRLTSVLRRTDTVARQSGDQFVLILPDSLGGRLTIDTILRLQDAISQPVQLDGNWLQCTGCFGISVYPKDGTDPEHLQSCADVALYRAKDQGQNNIQFFTSEMGKQLQDRLYMEKALRQAIEREEFELHYQPQVNLHTGMIVGVEALLRWQHPEKGMLMPAEFISLAEQTGLIVPIGGWVIRQACMQNKLWQSAGLRPLRVAVNLSARQFTEPDLKEMVTSALEESGLEAKYLEIEMTESLVMSDVEQAVDLLSELKALGVRLSIDDFGTGYSSLSYLKRFPIDTLKIDQTFVRDLTLSSNDATIVRSIISLAHSLRMQVIAEGVETQAKMAYLRRYDCDEMQGYFFSRPIPSRELEKMLRQGKSLCPQVDEPPALLLVENSRNVDKDLPRLLERCGYRILLAESATESFDYLAAHHVQVVISDSQLPMTQGTELLRQVRDLYPDTVRILLAGDDDIEKISDAVNAGVVYRYLTKPWDEAMLQHTVQEAFRHHDMIHRIMYRQ